MKLTQRQVKPKMLTIINASEQEWYDLGTLRVMYMDIEKYI